MKIRKVKIFVTLLFVFCMIASMSKVFAITSLSLDKWSSTNQFLYNGEGHTYNKYRLQLDNGSVIVGYCVEPEKKYSGNVGYGINNSYSLSNEQKCKISYIISQGGYNEQERQGAVWCIVSGDKLTVDNGGNKDRVNQLIAEANAAWNGTSCSTGSTSSASVSSTQLTFGYDSNLDAFVSNVINVNVSGSATVSMSGPNGAYLQLNGNNTGNPTSISSSAGFRVVCPRTAFTGKHMVSLKVETSGGTVTNYTECTIYVGISNTVMNKVVYGQAVATPNQSTGGSQPATAEGNGQVSRPMGNLAVAKMNKYGELVAGANFHIVGPYGFDQWITTTEDYTRFNNIDCGEYTVYEIDAPTNMIKNETPVTVTMYEDQTVTATLRNEYQRGTVTLKKVDAHHPEKTLGDATIAGAKYSFYAAEEIKEGKTVIYRKDQLIRDNIITKEDGTTDVINDLPIGHYYYKEITPSEGFNINGATVPVSVEYAGQLATSCVPVNVEQAEIPIYYNLDIYKVLAETDYDPEIVLPGCQFKLTLKKDNTQVYESTVSGADGICSFTHIPYGLYEVEEIQCPDEAFRVDNFDKELKHQADNYTFTCKDNERVIDKSKEMQIEVYKELIEEAQGKTDASVEGAVFTVYLDENCENEYIDKNGAVVTVGPTDETGYAISGTMRTGRYYLKETTFPDGTDENKILPGESVSAKDKIFMVYYDNKKQVVREDPPVVVSINPKNVPYLGRVQVVKFNDKNLDTENSAAEGAKLRLTLKSNPECYYEAEIDKTGSLEFINDDLYKLYNPLSIPYGEYSLTEVRESNDGNSYFYYIQNETVDINIKNETEKRIVSDNSIDSFLKVIKIDEDTNTVVKLDGATFRVWDLNNNCWLQQVTMQGVKTEFRQEEETGMMYFPEKLEAGEYILYETKAPEGYYLNEKYRVPMDKDGNILDGGLDKGGKYFKIDKVASDIVESTEATIPDLVVEVEMYDEELKGKIEVFKTGERLVDSSKKAQEVEELNENYDVTKAIYAERALPGVKYKVYAAEDIKSPDGQVLHHEAGKYIETIETGADGIATTSELFCGKYKLIEVENPKGYVIDATPIEVEIVNKDELVRVKVENLKEFNVRQKLKVTVEKIFEESNYSDNAENKKVAIFAVAAAESINNCDGQKVIEENDIMYLLRYEDGKLNIDEMDLPEGTYNIYEIYASKPYKVSQTVVGTHVEGDNSNNKTVILPAGKIENTYDKANLYMVKVSPRILGAPTYRGSVLDESELAEAIAQFESEFKALSDDARVEFLKEKGIGLGGARYAIYLDKECTKPLFVLREDKWVEAVVESDADGICSLENIPLGKYYMKEIVAPLGYKVNPGVEEIVINEKDTIICKALKDDNEIPVFLTKTDIFTGEVIPDCIFEITDEDGEVIYYGITDDNGKVNMPIAMFDSGKTYYYHEISAPEIYDLNPEKHKFTAEYVVETDEYGNQYYKWTADLVHVSNLRKTKPVLVRKIDDETGEPLQGCKFDIVLLDAPGGNPKLNPDGEIVYLVQGAVTNEDGEYLIEKAPYGSYKFIEVEAPEGYDLAEQKMEGYEFTVSDESGDLIEFVVTNTGDIAVYALSAMALISALGIAVTLRKKALNK